MLILETRFSEAGAAESLEIGKMEVGSSNRSGRLCKLYGTAFHKSGRHCKACDEINLICLMYLDLSVALTIEDLASVKGVCVRCGWCVSAFWMLCEGSVSALFVLCECSVKGLCVGCGWCLTALCKLCEGCIAAVAFSHIVSGAIMHVSSSLLKCSMS